jgi:protein-L-isoaspartate(D-aspartate) O-methyltransferase
MLGDLIDRYVRQLKDEACGAPLTSPQVERALRTVPRHLLVERFWYVPYERMEQREAPTEYVLDPEDPDPELLELVYSDEALLTRLDDQGRATSSTSQPSLVVVMLELLDLAPGMKVLEIGAGTGYNAALMAELVGDPALVTTIDIQPEVVAQTSRLLERAGYGGIQVLEGDGALGHNEGAPYERVVATVGCPDISWAWAEQLTDEGLMLIPFQHGGPGAAPLVELRRENGHLAGRFPAYAGFMPLQGSMAGPNLWPSELPSPGDEPQTFPLFPALEASGMDWVSYRAGRRAWWDFHFFLALCDRRAVRTFKLGMVDPGGSMLDITPEGILVWGDLALYGELAAVYRQWEELGRPELTDWQVEIHPGREGPEGAWTIERAGSREVFHL